MAAASACSPSIVDRRRRGMPCLGRPGGQLAQLLRQAQRLGAGRGQRGLGYMVLERGRGALARSPRTSDACQAEALTRALVIGDAAFFVAESDQA